MTDKSGGKHKAPETGYRVEAREGCNKRKFIISLVSETEAAATIPTVYNMTNIFAGGGNSFDSPIKDGRLITHDIDTPQGA